MHIAYDKDSGLIFATGTDAQNCATQCLLAEMDTDEISYAPCTDGLYQAVEDRGGEISYAWCGRVACTVDEREMATEVDAFTSDNTQGYSNDALRQLNRSYCEWLVMHLDADAQDRQVAQERIIREYDNR